MVNNKYLNASSIAAGIAIFSMFFGAGNVIFPLILGSSAGSQIDIALVGLILSGIGLPLLGLFAVILFRGDCKEFYCRMGIIPGYLIVFLLLLLVGPFGAMPRCITVAHGALTTYIPQMSLFVFSILAGIITLFFIAKRNFVLPILGFVLSPVLLISLIVIIVMGFISPNDPQIVDMSAISAISHGLHVGYDTMDFLVSIFFAVVIWDLLKEKLNIITVEETKSRLIPTTATACIIGGVLLGLIYVGLSKAAAENMLVLEHVPDQEVLPALAIHILGPKLAFVSNIAVAFACLTTVISLAVMIVDVIHVELDNSPIGQKINFKYGWTIVFVIIITVIFSNFGFANIMAYLHPIVAICYPALLVLTLCNILYKLFGLKFVKLPVYLTLALALGWDLYLRFVV